VKDEELAQMAHDLRARDATIREMADRLSETAEAAEAAAAAAMQMDRDRKAAVSEAAQARRLADGALKEAEARIKEAQEGAARKVRESPCW
jgi:peptide deformylase